MNINEDSFSYHHFSTILLLQKNRRHFSTNTYLDYPSGRLYNHIILLNVRKKQIFTHLLAYQVILLSHSPVHFFCVLYLLHQHGIWNHLYVLDKRTMMIIVVQTNRYTISKIIIYLHQFHIQSHIWRKTHKNRPVHAYLL